MSPNVEQGLKNSYPELFSKISDIECEDGWSEIIGRLSAYISTLVYFKNIDPVYFTQIKEKFGELKVYTDKSPPLIAGAIDFATIMSNVICEVCGDKATTQKLRNGLYKTVCERHYNDRD